GVDALQPVNHKRRAILPCQGQSKIGFIAHDSASWVVELTDDDNTGVSGRAGITPREQRI
ncbi:MAG TPA: hypothetical protein VLC12_04355, partial [Terriglobales bacterium]|nr:hypothetical protein [Terriglobales bacterium]